MQDLIIESEELRKQLNNNIDELKIVGYKKAKAEYDYRVALSKEIMIQRNQGVPVTIINDVVRGNENIAKLKFQRDYAETLYDTTKQKIYATKIELEIVENQLQAERKGE
ncbi:hypothetical protein [Sporanaerobacter acetigenes]|uniref:hypothetical protein n=1 Tax=Sporanaerobacter acetigenes TaxID=165813 RepID=UPI00104C3B8C|nr:hypothetical protein [Sporanaerobacter acetigenes]